MSVLDDAFAVQVAANKEAQLEYAICFYLLYDMSPKMERVQNWRESEIDGNQTPFFEFVPVVPEEIVLNAHLHKVIWNKNETWFGDIPKKEYTFKGLKPGTSIPKFYTKAALDFMEQQNEQT
jgi:hypothetical protein